MKSSDVVGLEFFKALGIEIKDCRKLTVVLEAGKP